VYREQTRQPQSLDRPAPVLGIARVLILLRALGGKQYQPMPRGAGGLQHNPSMSTPMARILQHSLPDSPRPSHSAGLSLGSTPRRGESFSMVFGPRFTHAQPPRHKAGKIDFPRCARAFGPPAAKVGGTCLPEHAKSKQRPGESASLGFSSDCLLHGFFRAVGPCEIFF